jgi:hypothetical protein
MNRFDPDSSLNKTSHHHLRGWFYARDFDATSMAIATSSHERMANCVADSHGVFPLAGRTVLSVVSRHQWIATSATVSRRPLLLVWISDREAVTVRSNSGRSDQPSQFEHGYVAAIRECGVPLPYRSSSRAHAPTSPACQRCRRLQEQASAILTGGRKMRARLYSE